MDDTTPAHADPGPSPAPDHPSLAGLLWIALPWTIFLVRSILWWRNLALGRVDVAAMTTADWTKVVLSHAAVATGLILLAFLLWQRSAARRSAEA